MEGNLRLLLNAAKQAGADEPDTIVKFITGDGKNHSIESITEALNLASQSDKFDTGIRKGFANVLNFFSKGLEQRTVQKVGNGFVMLPDTADKNSIGAEFRKLQLSRKMDIKKYSKLSTLVDNLDSQLKRCAGNESEQKKVIEDLSRQLLNLKSEKGLIPKKAVGTIIGGIANATGLSVGAVSGLIGGVIGLGVGIGIGELSKYLSSGRRYNSSYERKMNTVFGSKQDSYIPGQDSILFMEDKDIQPNYTQYIPFITPSYHDASGNVTGIEGKTITSQQVADYMKPLHNDGTTKKWADEHIRKDGFQIYGNKKANAIDQMVNSFNASLGSHKFTGEDDKREIATFAVEKGWVRQGRSYVNLNDPKKRFKVETLVQELSEYGII